MGVGFYFRHPHQQSRTQREGGLPIGASRIILGRNQTPSSFTASPCTVEFEEFSAGGLIVLFVDSATVAVSSVVCTCNMLCILVWVSITVSGAMVHRRSNRKQ
jgi:hypothetical protein